MKTALAILATSICCSLPFVNADSDRDSYALDNHGISLNMEVVRLPQFPRNLINQGYAMGEVHLALDINYDGELRDWLVTDTTHPDFVAAIENVIDDWRFSPPYINGENRSVVGHLKIDFTVKSAVISLDTTTFLSARFAELTQYSSERVTLADPSTLDAKPYPISQITPAVPQEVLRENDGTRAIFTFYLDESGQVRIPSLSQTDGNPDIGMLVAAQDALSQWRFEPPTVRNRPVKVKLSQTFVFKDK